MLLLCHRATKTENQLMPFYFSRHVDHSTLHLSLLPLHVYNSISIPAVPSWVHLFIATRSTNSCRREELRFPTDHVSGSKRNIQQDIMLYCLRERVVNWQKFGASHWNISGPDSETAITISYYMFMVHKITVAKKEKKSQTCSSETTIFTVKELPATWHWGKLS